MSKPSKPSKASSGSTARATRAAVSSGSPTTSACKLGLPKSSRVRHRNEFQRVFSKGKVVADGTLVVHGVRPQRDAIVGSGPAGSQPLPLSRLGLSISKKVGNAPRRNLWKRRIREAFRHQRHALPRDLLIVVRPKKGAEPIYAEIYRSLPRLIARLDKRLGS